MEMWLLTSTLPLASAAAPPKWISSTKELVEDVHGIPLQHSSCCQEGGRDRRLCYLQRWDLTLLTWYCQQLNNPDTTCLEGMGTVSGLHKHVGLMSVGEVKAVRTLYWKCMPPGPPCPPGPPSPDNPASPCWTIRTMMSNHVSDTNTITKTMRYSC